MRDHYDFSGGVRGKYAGTVDSTDIPVVPVKSPEQQRGVKSDDRVFVEHRPQGDYAVRRPGSERASAVVQTQAAAIARARELTQGSILVERVRNTSAGGRDKWRKA